jgi:hypothetical protein
MHHHPLTFACFAVLCLLSSCESTTGGSGDTAMRRRMQERDYQREREAREGMPVSPGTTIIWGMGIGTHTDGFAPISNPSALYQIPQSR